MVQEIEPEAVSRRGDPLRSPVANTAREIEPEAVSRRGELLRSPVAGHKSAREEWREGFPYPWNEDDKVTRRESLRFLLVGGGALCLATGILAILDTLPAGPTVQSVAVAKVGELAEHEWKVFNFPDQYAQGILINLPKKGLVAYSNVCTHLSCAVLYKGDGKLHCPCHDGLFDAATGNVLAGPPPRPLSLIQLAIHDGTIYAVKQVRR